MPTTYIVREVTEYEVTIPDPDEDTNATQAVLDTFNSDPTQTRLVNIIAQDVVGKAVTQ